MRKYWDESGLTIVLLPSGQQGDSLYETAKLWVELRLIGPALWIRPEYLQSQKVRPPKQLARVLGYTRDKPQLEIDVDLFEQLARQSLRLVRLVVVRSSVPNVEFDSKQDELVDIISEYLNYSMPSRPQRPEASNEQTGLHTVSLLTSPTAFSSPDASLLRKEIFHAHFVAAAEDRATPLSGDAFVRYEKDSQKFAGFTMLHLASVGALWVGLPMGLLELVNPGMAITNQAFVSRVFVSGILTDGLSRRAATRVLDRVGDPSAGLIDSQLALSIPGTTPIPENSESVDQYLDYMVQLALNFDGEILQYKSVKDFQGPEKQKITAGYQFRDFTKFSVDKIVKTPYFAWMWIYRAFVSLINKMFQGDDGSATIPVPPEKLGKLDEAVQSQIARVAETRDRADATLRSPILASKRRATKSLWTDLRKLVFGILDSSNLENFGFKRGENGWPTFYRVASVFPNPLDRLHVTDVANPTESISVEWVDIDHAVALIDGLEKQADVTRVEIENLLMSQPALADQKLELEVRIQQLVDAIRIKEEQKQREKLEEAPRKTNAKPSVASSKVALDGEAGVEA